MWLSTLTSPVSAAGRGSHGATMIGSILDVRNAACGAMAVLICPVREGLNLGTEAGNRESNRMVQQDEQRVVSEGGKA